MPPDKTHLWSTVLLLGLLSSQALAQEPGQVRQAVPPEEAERPTLEFLEFLGDWETDDGEWIDPEELEHIAIVDQEYDDEQQK